MEEIMKNKMFIHQYKIQIKGVTTNDFTSNIFESVLKAVVTVWNREHKTTQAEMIKEEIKYNPVQSGKSTYGFKMLIEGSLKRDEVGMFSTPDGNVFIMSEEKYNKLRKVV